MVIEVKNLPVYAGDFRDAGSIPGSVDPLEKEMVSHSSILAYCIVQGMLLNTL